MQQLQASVVESELHCRALALKRTVAEAIVVHICEYDGVIGNIW